MMDSIRREVGLSDTKTLDASSYQWVTMELQGETKKELASRCSRGNENALTYSIIPEGYPKDQFHVVLRNLPQDDADPDRKIAWVALSPNITLTGKNTFKKGTEIEKYKTRAQSFKRTNEGEIYITLGIEGLPREISNVIDEPAKSSINAGNPRFSSISFVTNRRSPHDIVTLELEDAKILPYNKDTKTGLDGNSWEVITGTKKNSQGKMEITWRSRDPRILQAKTSHGPHNRCYQKIKKIYTLTPTSVTEEKTIFKVPHKDCPHEAKTNKVEYPRLR